MQNGGFNRHFESECIRSLRNRVLSTTIKEEKIVVVLFFLVLISNICLYRWVTAILLKVPIQCIGTYNSIVLTHRYMGNVLKKGDNFLMKGCLMHLKSVSTLVSAVCTG